MLIVGPVDWSLYLGPRTPDARNFMKDMLFPAKWFNWRQHEFTGDMVRLVKPLRFYPKQVRRALMAKKQRQKREAKKGRETEK